jgi:hypothetical protein
MIEEPIRLDEVPEDDAHPATKRELRELKQSLDEKAARADLTALRQDIARWKQETFDHFDAAVENIAESLVGANRDELSLLADVKTDHEGRLQALERRAGMR